MEPMSYDLSENPLHLSLSVGVSSLDDASGAAFGNAIVAVVIGMILHLVAKAQKARCLIQ